MSIIRIDLIKLTDSHTKIDAENMSLAFGETVQLIASYNNTVDLNTISRSVYDAIFKNEGNNPTDQISFDTLVNQYIIKMKKGGREISLRFNQEKILLNHKISALEYKINDFIIRLTDE